MGTPSIRKYYDGPRSRLLEHILPLAKNMDPDGDTAKTALDVRYDVGSDPGAHSLLRDTYELIHGILEHNDHPRN